MLVWLLRLLGQLRPAPAIKPATKKETMYTYGRKSTEQRRLLHPWLQLVLLKTLALHDHSVDQGGRTDTEQWEVYNRGASTLHPPDGKHLLGQDPAKEFNGAWSFAADVCPYINGQRVATSKDAFGPVQQAQFAYFLATLKAVADSVLSGTGWEIRLGVNWDMDAEILSDQDFDDWFHVELVWRGL